MKISRIIYLLLLSMATGNLYAQNAPRADSLKNSLYLAKSDTSKVSALNRLFDYYIYDSLNTSIQYVQEAVRISESLPDQKYYVQSVNNLAYALRIHGAVDSAIFYYSKALHAAIAITIPKELLKACRVLATPTGEKAISSKPNNTS